MRSSFSLLGRQLGAMLNAHLGIGRLFAAALIPGILAGSILFHDIYQNERAQLEQGALQTARALSQAVERDLAGIHGKLQILATAPSLQSGDFAAFQRQAEVALLNETVASAIVLLDASGQQLVNTLQPYGGVLPRTGQPELLRRTFETRAPCVSDFYIGALSRRPFVALAVPVLRGEQVIYGLDMGIPLDRLKQLLVAQKLPPGWIAALLDSKGTIIARSQNGERTVGRPATFDLRAQIARSDEGTLAADSVEGLPLFIAYSRSRTSGWTVAIGMTRGLLYSQLYRPLALAGLTILAFLCGGALLAWVFSRHVREALQMLGAATEAATGGDLDALAPLAGPREIVLLAQQFNRMQQARKEAEAQLRLAASVFGAAGEGIIIADRNYRIIDVNASFTELTGYLKADVAGPSPPILAEGKAGPAFYYAMRQAADQAGRWQGEICDRRKDGALFCAHMMLSAVKDEAGRVSHYVALLSDVTDIRRQQDEIEHLVYYDPLTHLANRRLLSDRILQALALAERNHTLLAVCYLDLDGFKPVNDAYGHEAGDRVLIEVARRLERVVRAHDTVARLGGDEFVVLLTGLGVQGEGEAILSRVLHAIGEPFLVNGQAVHISVSIGVAFCPDDGSEPDVLLRLSDQAMYQAKRAGRNQVQRALTEGGPAPLLARQG